MKIPLSLPAIPALLLATAIAIATLPALAAPLPGNRNIQIQVSNDAGARYGSGPLDTYFINAPGGGLNQLHISTDDSTAGLAGQVTARTVGTSSASGSFWVTTTGGRGYNDDVIVLLSVQGPISDSFSAHLSSSGYQWNASASGVVNPVYVSGAIDETFDRSDFLYGPQTTKPGPGTAATLPFYSGQNIADPSTAQFLLFADLYVGNTSDRSATDLGSARVDFDLSGIAGDTVSFNAYAYALFADVANDSINWTNRLSTNAADAGQSGYSIASAVAPVPEPTVGWLLAGGLAALAFQRGSSRRRAFVFPDPAA